MRARKPKRAASAKLGERLRRVTRVVAPFARRRQCRFIRPPLLCPRNLPRSLQLTGKRQFNVIIFSPISYREVSISSSFLFCFCLHSGGLQRLLPNLRVCFAE